ncbi:Os04g0402250 [Oryza sativa Japonica Group]|uniref:Os04g0402250 protein n=2 Tax=Oryza sativa subsp. japonica TaxID=39947 RepID=C7J1A7_ORYSJ|nr:Os04g0402250 [Oryza sativa Japonica Group]BAS89053.1 Os04g0402250 [Oryza sativa Japonica Group]|eukprot:NP_001173919.1 Os04g0402250 [Oryza sativa Japonica Group]
MVAYTITYNVYKRGYTSAPYLDASNVNLDIKETGNQVHTNSTSIANMLYNGFQALPFVFSNETLGIERSAISNCRWWQISY